MINILIGQKLFSFSFRRFGFSLLIFINLILSPIENIGFAVTVADEDEIFDSATIGPELTFTNHILKQNWMKRMELYYYFKVFTFGLGHLKGNGSFQIPTKKSELAWATILKDAILKSCKDCSLETKKGKFGLPQYRITFPNQYWIVVATDPQVVELQTKPLSLNEYRELEPYIQTHIYNIAEDICLYPTTYTDGHSNIGVKSAFSNVKELANFYLDTYNHPELGFGVLGFDTHNAPSLLLQTQLQINALKTILKEIEFDEIVDFEGFAKAINYRVYYRSKDFRKKSSGRHYQGFSLKRLLSDVFQVEDLPLEIRFTASRPNFQMVILNYELILKRIQFLKKSEFKNIMLYHKIDPNFDLEMSNSEQLSRFFIYVTEMGEDFNRYKPLIYNYKMH